MGQCQLIAGCEDHDFRLPDGFHLNNVREGQRDRGSWRQPPDIFNSVSPFARFPDLKRIWCSGPKPSANRARWPFTPRVFMRDNAVRAFGNIDSGKDAHRFRLDNVTIEGRAQGCLPHQHAALAKPGFGQTHGVSIYRLSSHAGCRWRPVPAWPDTGVRRSLLTRFRWGEQLPLRVAGRWLRHG